MIENSLHFHVAGSDDMELQVNHVWNAGWAGRSQADIAAHIEELAALGVPIPTETPCVYALPRHIAVHDDRVEVRHGTTSGEAEYLLVLNEDGNVFMGVACDHTDRMLEVHGVAWSKQAAPDILGRTVWKYSEVADHVDLIELKAWVRHGSEWIQAQNGTLAELLPPQYWLDVLVPQCSSEGGGILLSGTIPMIQGVDQFGEGWRVEMTDPVLQRAIRCEYAVSVLSDPRVALSTMKEQDSHE